MGNERQFLCARHRDWVYFNAAEAICYMEEAWQKGDLLIAQFYWKEAIPFIGCALETCDILLMLHPPKQKSMLAKLTLLTFKLRACLLNLGEVRRANQVVSHSLEVLADARKEQSLRQSVLIYLKSCEKSLQNAICVGNVLESFTEKTGTEEPFSEKPFIEKSIAEKPVRQTKTETARMQVH